MMCKKSGKYKRKVYTRKIHWVALMLGAPLSVVSNFFFFKNHILANPQLYIGVPVKPSIHITALHKWGGAHQTSNHLPKPNL